MRIISFRRIQDYISDHADAGTALKDWNKRATKSEWTCFADIKKTFNSVDSVGNDRYVFNIKGNNHRLIVLILFASKKIYIRFIGTHSEYERIDAKNI